MAGIGRSHIWMGTAAVLFALPLVVPALAQESLLPPGFNAPPARPSPSPSPAPSPSPTPRATPSPSAPPSGGTARPAAPRAANGAAPAPSLAPSLTGDAPLSTDDAALMGEEALPPPPPRYDLPPGSRRLLSRVGPLTAAEGSLSPNAFGNRGIFVTQLMDKMGATSVSRWASILLRRTLLSSVDAPSNINGADFVAARAWLLLRQGESPAARMLVQSVDVDRASPRLKAVALQVALANADPAGVCSYTPAMVGTNPTWDMAHAMCSSLIGESGPAGAIIERVRRRGQAPAIDVKLAEKIVGAGANSNRNVTVRWDNVSSLTSWRFGLASAGGLDIPDNLWTGADASMRGWALHTAMVSPERRWSLAAEGARRGWLSSRAYVDMLSAAEAADEPTADVIDKGQYLRGAFTYVRRADRISAIESLLSLEQDRYSGLVLSARAAARIGPADVSDADAALLLSAMFAGGLDNNAMAWAPNVAVGSAAWGLLAVGSPRPLLGTDPGDINEYAGGDDSSDKLRTRFLAAALIGLGRINAEQGAEVAREHGLNLNQQSRWSQAIDIAAERGEAGTVALLAAIGLQGRGWDGVPPYHLYHITRALRQVGLGPEARMIAAEALTRV